MSASVPVVLGASSVVLTSEGAKASEAVGGGGGRFGAKARSARATERSVRTVRVREGAGGDRSRVGEVVGGRGTERSGATERPEWL